MGILSGLGKLTGAAIRTTVALPVAAVVDAATLFGAVTGTRSALAKQGEKIAEEFEEGIEELGAKENS